MRKKIEFVPDDFDTPTILPDSQEQADRWQKNNREWWEKNPMRYNWNEEITQPEFSREFYEEIDRRFYTSAAMFMPYKKRPFEALIDFDGLRDKDVLEVGCGQGSHAQLIAPHTKSYTGIDLTERGVLTTTKRMEVFGIKATIRQMDVEKMDFPDGSFDFVWSWGVVHSTANPVIACEQIARVLRPGGKFTAMVYNRSLFHYYIWRGILQGIAYGYLFKNKNFHRSVQYGTDGAFARYYTAPEWELMVAKFFRVDRVHVHGQKDEIIPLPAGPFKNKLLKIIPNRLSTFVTNDLKQGMYITFEMTKK